MPERRHPDHQGLVVDGHEFTGHPLTLRSVLDLVLTSQDYESALAAVAHLTLPDFGAWSIVDIIEDPDSMRRLAIIHPDPEKQELARALPTNWPPATEDPIGAPVVMRTREPHVVDEVTDEMLVEVARSDENLETLRELGLGSFVVVPLLVGHRVLGAVTFVSDRAGHQYSEDDLAEAEETAALIALVIHNARLHRDTSAARDRAHRTAEEATRQRRDLERITEVQSRLVQGFSHDLKNPLGAALGHSELLERGLKGDLDPEQRASIERISASIQSALDLIDELVDYASRKMEKLDIRTGPTDVGEITREIAEEYRAQVEGAGLEFEVDTDATIPLIWSDRIRIRQVLGNLFSNAVKYTDEGRIEVRTEVQQSGATADAGEAVAIRVSDTGSGIPEDKHDLVFEEFARLDPDATQGAGLGLSISRSIANALGGEITIESLNGEGSTFTLWLPLLPVREEDHQESQAALAETGTLHTP